MGLSKASWAASKKPENGKGIGFSSAILNFQVLTLRRLLKDTTPLQRGIIRHTILMLDLSVAMIEKDLRPTRHLLTITYAIAFIREFFEQNPISQLGILGMREGLAIRVSDMSGNPNDHIAAVRALRGTEPKGNPSLQNGLDMARAALYHTPSHGTREVVIILGALLTSDPGDIHDTIKACIKDRIRVSIIGLAAQMHICAEICRKTNSGDDNCYNVAVDEVHFRELLMGITTPPVVRSTDAEAQKLNQAALLMMGFPSRIVEEQATLCACHGNLTRGGYLCSRCKAKVCSLPATCPTCDLTLILSTHLARSYHHLFPLRNWVEVSWERAHRKGSEQCFGCLSAFPRVHNETNGTTTGKTHTKRAEGASESSRYECETCENHFCIDCDVFCHEVVHNCPGCTSSAHLPGAAE
jgi:transcription initiation factor TFIIH subunit 2